jgi:putative transposase
MSTYTQLDYHIVFATKGRTRVLDAAGCEELYRYIWTVTKNKGGHLYRIGGVEDHIHMLVGLGPAKCVCDLVKDVKVSSTFWLKERKLFPGFEGWQDGYGAFTCGAGDKKSIVEYIKGQAEHHRQKSFEEEFKAMLVHAGIEFDEKYLV